MSKITSLYKIDKNFSDTRLDRFIKMEVSKIPQSLIEKYIRKKKILVNKKKIKSSYKLITDDIVEIYFKPNIENTIKLKKITDNFNDLKILSKKIIFECEDYIILNKPAGISSQGGLKVKKNLIDILNSKNQKFYMVHRLDSDTVGLMIFAKNREFAKKFSNLLVS